MLISYEKHVRGLNAVGDASTWYAIDFIHNGFIDKIYLIQTGGDPNETKVSLYNSQRVLEGNSLSSGGVDPDGYYEGSPELHEVMEPFTLAPGQDFKHFFDSPRHFVNMDGEPPSAPIVWGHKIYIKIERPGATFDATFDLAIGGYYDN